MTRKISLTVLAMTSTVLAEAVAARARWTMPRHNEKHTHTRGGLGTVKAKAVRSAPLELRGVREVVLAAVAQYGYISNLRL